MDERQPNRYESEKRFCDVSANELVGRISDVELTHVGMSREWAVGWIKKEQDHEREQGPGARTVETLERFKVANDVGFVQVLVTRIPEYGKYLIAQYKEYLSHESNLTFLNLVQAEMLFHELGVPGAVIFANEWKFAGVGPCASPGPVFCEIHSMMLLKSDYLSNIVASCRGVALGVKISLEHLLSEFGSDPAYSTTRDLTTNYIYILNEELNRQR